MKYGYWTPVFGSWLRNTDDDSTKGEWSYIKDLAQNAERWGYELTLVPELYLNDIKKILIAVPPIELQNQFAEIVKQIDKQKFEIQKNLEEMQKLQESLMNKYFG